MKNKKESSAIGIIGYADGPTTVFVTDSEGRASADNQWQRVLNACKRQAVPKERNFTGEEIKSYIIEAYGAKEIELTPTRKLMLKVNVLSNFYPEALKTTAMPEKNVDKKTWLEWAQQTQIDLLDAARQVSDEAYGLSYAFLRIPHTEKTEIYYMARKEEQKKHENKHRRFFTRHRKAQSANLNEEEPEMLLELELSTAYMTLQNGCGALMNEIILWRGITKEDIEKCSPQFMAFAAAMRDTGKLKLV